LTPVVTVGRREKALDRLSEGVEGPVAVILNRIRFSTSLLGNHTRPAVFGGCSLVKSMDKRRRLFRPGLTTVAVIVLIAAAASTGIGADKSGLSAENACAEIRSGVSGLARAERAQADALQLAGNGADMAPVASHLHRLLGKVADLRATLHKISQSRLTHDPDVANCLKLGYRALYEAEKLTTEVEQILLNQVGYAVPARMRHDAASGRAA